MNAIIAMGVAVALTMVMLLSLRPTPELTVDPQAIVRHNQSVNGAGR